MRWDHAILLAAVVACVGSLLTQGLDRGREKPYAAPAAPMRATPAPPPPPRDMWAPEVPSDLRLPENLGLNEPFQPLVYPGGGGGSDIGNVLPWSGDIEADQHGRADAAPTMYGTASAPPQYGMVHEGTAQSLLDLEEARDGTASPRGDTAAAARSPLQPEAMRFTLRPWQEALPTLEPTMGGGEPLTILRSDDQTPAETPAATVTSTRTRTTLRPLA